MGFGQRVYPLESIRKMTFDYQTIMEAIRTANLEVLEQIAKNREDFPFCKNGFVGQDWVMDAIDCGCVEAVVWMLDQGATVPMEKSYAGYGLLHGVIEHESDEKYRMMKALIDAGADVNEIGIHGYTPSHHAAVRNDVEALRILFEHGADFNIRTTVDDYATPLEEAREINPQTAKDAIAFLEEKASGIRCE